MPNATTAQHLDRLRAGLAAYQRLITPTLVRRGTPVFGAGHKIIGNVGEDGVFHPAGEHITVTKVRNALKLHDPGTDVHAALSRFLAEHGGKSTPKTGKGGAKASASKTPPFTSEIGWTHPDEVRAHVNNWLARMDAKATSVTIGPLKDKWGQMDTNGHLIINEDVLKLPQRLGEFVIAHEVAHLKVANHGPVFKLLMTAYMPDWQERGRELRAHEKSLLQAKAPTTPKARGGKAAQSTASTTPRDTVGTLLTQVSLPRISGTLTRETETTDEQHVTRHITQMADGTTLDHGPADLAILATYTGHPMTAQDALELFGVPVAGTLTLTTASGQPLRLRASIQSLGVRVYLHLVRSKGKAPKTTIHIDEARTVGPLRGHGRMTDIVGRMAIAAYGHGISALALSAAGWGNGTPTFPEVTGYYAWPRMGFNAPLTHVEGDLRLSPDGPTFAERLAASPYHTAKTITDIIAAPGGKDWWRQFGTSAKLTFSTTSATSRNMRILLGYLKEKRQQEQRTALATPPLGQGIDLALTTKDEAILDRVWAEVAADGHDLLHRFTALRAAYLAAVHQVMEPDLIRTFDQLAWDENLHPRGAGGKFIGGDGLHAEREAYHLNAIMRRFNEHATHYPAEEVAKAKAQMSWRGIKGYDAIQAHLAQLQTQAETEARTLLSRHTDRAELLALRQAYQARISGTKHLAASHPATARIRRELAIITSYLTRSKSALPSTQVKYPHDLMGQIQRGIAADKAREGYTPPAAGGRPKPLVTEGGASPTPGLVTSDQQAASGKQSDPSDEDDWLHQILRLRQSLARYQMLIEPLAGLSGGTGAHAGRAVAAETVQGRLAALRDGLARYQRLCGDGPAGEVGWHHGVVSFGMASKRQPKSLMLPWR